LPFAVSSIFVPFLLFHFYFTTAGPSAHPIKFLYHVSPHGYLSRAGNSKILGSLGNEAGALYKEEQRTKKKYVLL
jgi:hypothetical protein